MNHLKIAVRFCIAFLVLQYNLYSQCPAPSINAQAGTGASTTICSGQCVNLTATVVPPPNSTTSYSYSSITYSTESYFGGSNAFATTLDDTWSDVIDIGFNFCFYGNTYNKCVIGSNGEITFDLTAANQPESWVCSQTLPNLVEHYPNTICGVYRDYNPYPGGVIRTYTTGVAPCRKFVVYWSGVTLFSCATPLSSFQIVLYESTNVIGVNIQNSTACVTWNGGRGLVGIQNGTGTSAVAPPSRNTLTPWTAINESWKFVPTAAPVYNVSWAGPNGFTASGLTAAVCPTATSNYTATMSYCSGSITSVAQVSVNTPTVGATASSQTICPPSTTTLTGTGATSYTWQTPSGSVVGQTIAVSPTITTTYTVLGSSGSCTGSKTIQITVNTPPSVSGFNLSGTVCPGNPVQLVGTGALTYTWFPGGAQGNIVIVNPTVTTTYTVVGSLGTCTGQATVLAPVSNGPTLTTVASPTAICPGNSSTLSASGAISYTWNPGGTISSSISVSPATTTTYSVTGVDALGCTSTKTISLVVSTIPTVAISPATPTICVGTSTTLTASGASSYTWSPGGSNATSIVVSPTTTTSYTIVGSNGTCTSSATGTVSVVPIPTVSASSSTTSVCSGTSLTLTASGATTYTWNPGNLTGANVIVTPTISTTYTVVGASGSCTSSAVISVTVNNGPTLNPSASPSVICAGGSSTLSASGAVSYTWNPGAITGSTANVTPASSTIYSVTGKNGFGCSTTQTVAVTVNPNPTITLSSSSSSVCIGSSATLTASGATSYTWNPGALTGSNVVVTPTANTTYTVNGSTLGCGGQNTIAISVVPIPTVTASSNPTVICNGNSATLTASGASSYTWSPGALTGSNAVVSPTTNTTYTVTGNNGTCASPATVALVVNPTPTIAATPSPSSICVSGNVTITASGASTYSWMPGSLTGSSVVVSPTVTTNYTITATSAAGCTNVATTTVVVNSVPALTVAASPTANCAGASSTLTAQGATTYTWMPGSLTGSNVVVSPTTTTTYTVTGANGACSATQTVTLLVNPNPTVTASASPTSICSGSSATLTANGAATYTWLPGSLTGSAVAVTPTATTIYTVTGSSALGCTNSTTVNLAVTPLPTITAVANPSAICVGNSSTLTANGATSYTWNPGALTGSNAVVSPTTSTTYTITGANGVCTGTQTLNLVVNPLPTLTATASSPTICAGQSTSLAASGANSYTWTPGSLSGSTVVVSPTITTTYTVTGTSSLGCVNTQTTTVTVNPLPTLSVTASATNICAGSSATLTGSGGVSYFWNPGGIPGNPITVSPTVTTTYTLFGTSGAGCVNTFPFTLSVTPVPTITAVSNPTAICIGNSATVTATGATSYTWNPGALTGSNVVVTPTITTTYTISGANGICNSTKTIAVVVNSLPTLTLAANAATVCAGVSSTLTAAGASTYTWNPGALTGANVVVTPTVTTTYSATGTNSSGCTNSQTVTVTVNPLPALSISSTATTICAGSSATLTGSGASTYTWSPGGSTASTLAASPATTSTFVLTGASAAGCTNTALFTLSVAPVPTVTAVSNPTAICLGNSATLTANGASSYTWNPGGLTGSNVAVSPTVNTTYTVNGANGICNTTQTVSVIVNPVPTITATANAASICAGASSTLTASGAATYTWMPGSLSTTNIVVSPTVTTTYTVTGANGFGCTGTKTLVVNVNPLPTLTINATSTVLCSGASATLTGSGAANYTWSPGGSNASTLVVTPTVNTTYTLTGASAAGCVSTKTILINSNTTPTITASASTTIICSGSSATFTSSGATTYTWNPGAATGSNVVVTPSNTTQYTVTGANGACTATTAISISVNPTPTVTVIASPTLICSGSSATLTASGATTYTWLPLSASGSTVAVNPTATTVYTVIGSGAGNCSTIKQYTLNVTPTPTATIAASASVICSGSSSTLTAGGASAYTWNPGAQTSTNIVVTPSITTTYTLTGTNAGCMGTSLITITVNALPTITANATPTLICAGLSATLTAGGASTYTWSPSGTTGTSIVVTPSNSSTFTVIGTNTNACSNSAIVSVSVIASPTLVAAASPTSICAGAAATLIANGASTYTWNPGAISGGVVTVTPATTTNYTVTGANAQGCTSTQTVQMVVYSTPTVTATASSSAICAGTSATLTAGGAATYTWLPSNTTNTSIVISPTVTSTYTLNGSNGNCGSASTTISVVVNSAPSVTAATSGTITCATPSVDLFGSSSSTSSAFAWSGPAGYTSTAQNPTAIAIPGSYTLTVNDILTGCSASATTAIVTDSTVPTVTAAVSGTITCASASATVSAATTATNVSYNWSGPGSFTTAAASFTVAAGGTYTVTVTDLSSNCPASTVVIVTTNTQVPITATLLPATCSGTAANNDGTLMASGFGSNDKYDLVSGSTYTGTATYATATLIPVSGIITNTLSNPSMITPYTIRFFAANGCSKDTTLFLLPTSCITNTVFGIAKAVSTPTVKADGSYDVNYYVVIKNSGAQQLNNIALNEDLTLTFPLPTTFSVTSAPVVTSVNSSLSINAAFDGSLQALMTNTATSSLAPGKSDTIAFTVNIKHNGNFGPFYNSVLGWASPSAGVILGDSSNTGYDPDPDLDGNPTNNNIPTPLSLPPKLFFGLTKQGSISDRLNDNTFDITYTITVHNLGNDTLKNVVVKDSLFNATIRQPATYTIKSGPVATGSLTANSNYNGNSDINLIIPSQSILPPGFVNTIIFTINVNPDTITVVKNSAFGRAMNTTSIVVSDTSNAGSNPDSNGNGVWNEPADNVPTVLSIPNSSLFIPQGFSPDGDQKNDFFVIHGLTGIENTFTVYNRWGNKVYSKSNYDNTWAGYPNVSGTLGSEKLPPGTYYYILELKSGEVKTMNGFIVIQY